MTAAHIAILPDRGVVSVTGEDARHFLDNLVTNDLDLLDRQEAVHAGLLSPQGKILFAFFIVRHGDGYLLDCRRDQAADLVKRLTLYKLRAKVALDDLSASRSVVAVWAGEPPQSDLHVVYRDPRAEHLGHRLIMAPETAARLAGQDEGPAAYDAHRVSLSVPEPGRDYVLGDAYPHEALFDRQAGVSFTKGCFVGQEVVARMQHKTVARKRVVRIVGASDLASGADVKVGETTIGTVGTVGHASEHSALAVLRLDRALEARQKGQALTAGGVEITVDPSALDAYEAAAGTRAT